MQAELERKATKSKGKKKKEPGTKTKESQISVHKKRPEPVTTWVRNSNGFAFRFVHQNIADTAWNKIRSDSINALDEDRGWNRCIDPPIPLYIVPCSDEVVKFMHISIVRAMNELDMASNVLVLDPGIMLQEKAHNKSLMKLKSAQLAKPECATTEVHLIKRSAIESMALVKVSR